MQAILSEKAVAIVAIICATFLAWKGILDPATAKGILYGAAAVSSGTGLQAILTRILAPAPAVASSGTNATAAQAEKDQPAP